MTTIVPLDEPSGLARGARDDAGGKARGVRTPAEFDSSLSLSATQKGSAAQSKKPVTCFGVFWVRCLNWFSSDVLSYFCILSFLAVTIAEASANEASRQCTYTVEPGALLGPSLQSSILVAFAVTMLSQAASMSWKFSSTSGVLHTIQNRAIYLLASGLLVLLCLCVLANLRGGVCLSDDVMMSICGAVNACTIHVLTEIMWAPARMNGRFVPLRRPEQIPHKLEANPNSGQNEVVLSSVVNFQTAALVCFTIPSLLGTFVDIRAKAAYSILSLAVSTVAILAWCSAWWRNCSSSISPAWLQSCAESYRACLRRRLGLRLQLAYRSIRTDSDGRKLLEQEFTATSLAMAFGALALCASVSVVAAESGICSILTSFTYDFSEETSLTGSAFASARLAQALSTCGDEWGLGMNSPMPRLVHIVIAFGVFVQLTVQAVAAWSRVVLQEALQAQAKQQSQSQAMLRWLSHECRSPAAAALLTLDVLTEEVFPQIRAQAALLGTSAHSTGSGAASGARTIASSPRLQLNALTKVDSPSEPPSAVPPSHTSASASAPRSRAGGDSSLKALVREAGSMMKMVAQPLHSLSGVLDNMLLFMQQQQGVQGEQAIVQMPLASNWLAAWSQATALQAMESMRPTDAKLRYIVPHECLVGPWSGQHVPAAASAAAEMREACNTDALQMMHSHDIRSRVTNATVQQVLSNLTSNAFKYGNDAAGSLDLRVQFGLACSRVQIEHLLRVCAPTSRRVGNSATPSSSPALERIAQQVDSTLAVARLHLSAGVGAAVTASAGRANGKGSTSKPPNGATACVLTVCVSDSGQGMTASEASTLFRPFTRLRSGRSAQGTGLGLWLMRQLMQSQGGTLEVHSAGRGRGSTFIAAMPVLFVPRERGGAEAPPLNLRHLDSFDHESYDSAAALSRQGSDTVPISGRETKSHAASTGGDLTQSSGNPLHNGIRHETHNPEKGSAAASARRESDRQFSVPDFIDAQYVLVVDDSVPIRRMMARYLRNAGMHVLTAENGREALAVLQAQWREGQPVRAVVTDMTMPVMNGDEMCKAIVQMTDPGRAAADQVMPRPALIGITGNAMSEDVDRFMASGTACVLTKPVPGKVIVGEVRARLAAMGTLEAVNASRVYSDTPGSKLTLVKLSSGSTD